MVHPVRRWGDSYLLVFVLHLLTNLQADPALCPLYADSLAVANGLQWEWFSGCSGTDSPKPALDAIMGAFQSLGATDCRHCHKASAEKAQCKRTFIKAFAAPEILLDDIFSLSDFSKVTDHMSASPVDAFALLQGLHHFVAGFSCKAFSSLNTKHSSISSTASNNMKTCSGYTLQAVYLALQRLAPMTAVLENVMNLRKSGQDKAITDKLASLGYVGAWHELNPIWFGHPQQRQRIYAFIISRALLVAADVTEEYVLTLFEQLVAVFRKGHQLVPVDEVLTPQYDTLIQERHAQDLHIVQEFRSGRVSCAQIEKRWSAEKVPKWLAKHAKQRVTCKRSIFKDEVHADLFPAY